jgi:hypothetical protein
LDLLALFRALDQMDLSPSEIPQVLLYRLFELDADYAEALWALDQAPGRLDHQAMLGETLTSLNQLPRAYSRFKKKLARRAHPTLEILEASIRKTLNPQEAYIQIPGRSPQKG